MDNEVETPTKKFARKRENRRRLSSEISRFKTMRGEILQRKSFEDNGGYAIKEPRRKLRRLMLGE